MKTTNTILTATLILTACLVAASPQLAPSVAGVVYLSDFADLQAAVTAVPNGGTVIIPRGIWEGDVVIPAGKYIHLQGVSPAMLGQSPVLGSPQWDVLLSAYPDTFMNGSILRGTIDATADAAKLSMTNIMMIGHGTGTAVKLGSSAAFGYGGVFDNVDIGNYQTGLHAIKSYNLTVNKMRLYGVGLGLKIEDSNLVRLRDIDILNCTLGADLGGEIVWQGGSVQSCAAGVVIYQTAGYIGGLHFEAVSGDALVFGGYGGKLDPCFYAANGGGLVVSGYNNIIEAGWVNSLRLTPASEGNIVSLSGGPYVNDGWRNKIIEATYP